MIRVDTFKCYLDFLLAADRYNVAVISYYDRSLSNIKAIGAALNYSNGRLDYLDTHGSVNTQYQLMGCEFDTYIQPIVVGKEKFYHAISINKMINKRLLILVEENEANNFYDYLMREFDLPLMREWAPKLFKKAKSEGLIVLDNGFNIPLLLKGKNSITNTIPVSENAINNEAVTLGLVRVYQSFMTASALKEMVSGLLRDGSIAISKAPQKELIFKDMDSYFKEYGHTLVANLEKTIQPLTSLNGEVKDFTLKHMRLYPQQIAQVNGILELLDYSTYGILNHGMGTGKTILGASICEGYYVRKFMRSNPGKTLKDAYLKEDIIKYRNIIMCPGHLVEKWASEIKKEIPYADVTIINDFSQLLDLRAKGIKRTHREYYIISKDFGKLSYQSRPSVSKRRFARIMKKVCFDCGEDYFTAGHTCPKCNSREYKLEKTVHKATGMVCPHCNQLLLPNKTASLSDFLSEEDFTHPLDHIDFKVQNEANSRCYYCENELWEPHVANLGDDGKIRTKWNRATHYTNKAHKGTKTVWVHKDYMDEYFSMIGEEPLNFISSEERRGVRKVSPVIFIKKYLKGYFDIAIFDEAHLYKGGTTGQGHAMHALIKSSKKHLALTGTIAGGYANHLFYLLYRLDPQRMRDKGYKFEDELKFTEKYGKLERTFEFNGGKEQNGAYNSNCKGRQKGSPKTRPGISPLIFMDFLLDKTTFLDLSDMSKYLPPLIEKVETVKIEGPFDSPEVMMKNHYDKVLDSLKLLSREKEGGRAILSSMLQFSLSYLNKPYGVSPIKSPKSGSVLVTPRSFDNFLDFTKRENLLSSEKRLIEIVNQEIYEGRNCFIYCEFTGSPETCVTYRLQSILDIHCDLKGKVAVLESSSPVASKREQWIHRKAKQGIKVFITNPKCTETGLDFCFKYEGKDYNYPTIIFYQLGYSMFTIAQASRRHFRLNQRKECRTYYIAYAGTVQEAVIRIIAEKQAATNAIQGKFSVEGLAAMAQGVDERLKLAQAMAELDTVSGNNLQEMFDVLNHNNEDDSKYKDYKPMLILSEILGDDAEAIEKTIGELGGEIDIFDMLEIFNFDNMAKVVEEKIKKNEVMDAELEESIFGIVDTTEQISMNTYRPPKRLKNKVMDEQLDMFAFL